MLIQTAAQGCHAQAGKIGIGILVAFELAIRDQKGVPLLAGCKRAQYGRLLFNQHLEFLTSRQRDGTEEKN